MKTSVEVERVQSAVADDPRHTTCKEPGFLWWGAVLLLLHGLAMFYRFGLNPPAPVYSDEIIINDPAIALSRGQGLIAPSFTDSAIGIDKLYAHFPPVYIYLQSLIFHYFGISVFSLRILTTVMSVAAAAVFILLMRSLCKWRLVEGRTALLLTCLYTLNASTIVLHRVSRMESLIEFLSLSALFCVLAGGYIPEDYDAGLDSLLRTDWGRLCLLFAGAVMAGLCLATHPESLTAVLPIAVLLVMAPTFRTSTKTALMAAMWLTPALIWFATYGSRWRVAVYQMFMIAEDEAPDPSIFRFGYRLLRNLRNSSHDVMIFTLFCMTLASMSLVVIRAIEAFRFSRNQPHRTGALSRSRFAIQLAFALSIPLTLALLMWLLPASITRYEAMYPVFLVAIAISPPERSSMLALYRSLRFGVGVLICMQFAGSLMYLHKHRLAADVSPARYDAVLDCIPGAAHVAASPQLWLAFQERNRPFTLLYRDFDGLSNWKARSSQPLDQFDVVLVDDSLKDEFKLYSSYAEPGRVKTEVQIGSHVLRVYSKYPLFNEPCGSAAKQMPHSQ